MNAKFNINGKPVQVVARIVDDSYYRKAWRDELPRVLYKITASNASGMINFPFHGSTNDRSNGKITLDYNDLAFALYCVAADAMYYDEIGYQKRVNKFDQLGLTIEEICDWYADMENQ